MKPFEYLQPKTLQDLFAFGVPPNATILAGGTDILPKIHYGSIKPDILIDISMIDEMNFISEDDEDIHIGSLTTYAKLLENASIRQNAPSLISSIRLIGAPMTRAKATIGGNIANASPAGDTLTPLLTLDAHLNLANIAARRSLKMKEFFIAPAKNKLEPGEIIYSISFKKPKGRWGASFKKVGPRRGMTISIVNTAVYLILKETGEIETCRIACGAVAPVPLRCTKTEDYLRSKSPSPELWEQASQITAHEISPIDDIRGSKEYRKKITSSLVQQCLKEAHEAAFERRP